MPAAISQEQNAPTPTAAPVDVTVPLGPARPDVVLGLPGSVEQVQGLRERRDILRDQLERATNRRENLLQELRTVSADGRQGVVDRLKLIDERILQLERDQALTERQLSNAPPELLAQVEQREPAHTGPSEDDVVGVGFGGFFLGLLVMLLATRIRRWRRGGERPTPRPEVAPDPRIERLTQAVDAIAVEVERIGEGQRFVTQLLADTRLRSPELADAGVTADALQAPGRPR